MMKTAYTLALEPTLPSRQFKTLVKVQRENGVRLIEGKFDILKLILHYACVWRTFQKTIFHSFSSRLVSLFSMRIIYWKNFSLFIFMVDFAIL